MKNKNSFEPDWKIPPCEHIKEMMIYSLKEKYLSKFDNFFTVEEFEDLINNKLEINEKYAEGLSKIFGPSKQFWLNLQNNYNKPKKSK